MIASHEHRYVFVEVPHTGSSAVRWELIEHYGGQEMLDKHSTLAEVVDALGSGLSSYRLAVGVRDPLDAAVSRYFKLVTNHRDNFTRPERRAHRGGWVTAEHLEQFDLVQDGADFSTWFLHAHDYVYVSPWWRAERNADVLLRFEQLGTDFDRLLGLLDLEPVRSLPRRNPTAERPQDPLEIYDDPAVRQRAVAVFGPHMEDHGYRWPVSWEIPSPPLLSRLFYVSRTARWRRAIPSPLQRLTARTIEWLWARRHLEPTTRYGQGWG